VTHATAAMRARRFTLPAILLAVWAACCGLGDSAPVNGHRGDATDGARVLKVGYIKVQRVCLHSTVAIVFRWPVGSPADVPFFRRLPGSDTQDGIYHTRRSIIPLRGTE